MSRSWGSRGSGHRRGGYSSQKPYHPFKVEADDHCETPLAAYKDVAPILEQFARSISKTPRTLKIYDPYYCDGAVKRNLYSLGFENVYNENKDFYATIEEETVPEFDILLTNPPYSTKPIDHIARLHEFCARTKCAYLILQPCYVYMNDYYRKFVLDNPQAKPCYLTPSARYVYETPKGFRDAATRTSPFVTLWYGQFGTHLEAIARWWCEEGNIQCKGCILKMTTSRLPHKFRYKHDPTRRRLRKKQRARLTRLRERAEEEAWLARRKRVARRTSFA